MVTTLPEHIQEWIMTFPETHGGVHTVTVTLADGRVFTGVEVAWATEVIRVHGHYEPPFAADQVVSVDDASGLS